MNYNTMPGIFKEVDKKEIFVLIQFCVGWSLKFVIKL